MWALQSFSVPKQLQKDLKMLGMIAHLYLLYKKGFVNADLPKEIYSLYHSQLLDGSLQELFTPLMTYLHRPDDFITAFENATLQGFGMSALVWKWLNNISSSLYHLLHETRESEENLFHFFLLLFALSAARNFPCIENDFWKWSSPSGRDFLNLFPNFICNFFYWKNFQNHSLNWEKCKKMFEEFLTLFPESLKKNTLYALLYSKLQNKFEQMKTASSHWPEGSYGWPSPMKSAARGGKWIEEMKQQLLFYLSLDNGFVALCQNVEDSSLLFNYTLELFSLFSSPLTLKNLEAIEQKLENIPKMSEIKDADASRLFSSLFLWKKHFLHATSFSVEYFDPKKRRNFFGTIPEPLEFSLFHPEQVFVTLFSDKRNTFSTTLFFIFTKNPVFKGLPDPRKELEEAFLKLI